MKTIQEYLKNCDRKSIINNYIYSYAFCPLDLMNDIAKDITIGELVEKYEYVLNKLIDKLANITPQKTKDTFIFLACHCPDTGDGDIVFNLYKKEDILNFNKDSLMIPYGYELMPFEECVSFFVADNYLTQFEINNLIVEFLHEVTWTGYNQEDRENLINKLEESAKEAELNKDNPDYYITHEEFKHKLETKCGIEFEKYDERQEKALKTFYKAQSDYFSLCRQIEVEKLKESLCSEHQNMAG